MANCVDCRAPFDDEGYLWKVRCVRCYVKMKREEEGLGDGWTQFHRPMPMPIHAELHELLEMIPKLIRLCHPDKHDNSPMATEVTQWLLSLKGR